MADRSYWVDRFTELEESQQNKGIEYYHELEKQYTKAASDIEKDIATWYSRFAVNNRITMAEARKILTNNELKELRWSVEEYIEHGRENNINGRWMKELENASARVHISRLEALKLQMQQHCEVLFGNEADSFDKVMRNVYTEGYYRTAFELQKGVGVGYDLMKLDKNKIDKVISKPWAADGSNFSSRIWKQRSQMVSELHNQLTQMVIRGQTPDAAINAIKERFRVSKGQAARLVVTETAFFHSAAQKDSFNNLGVAKYEICAVLDHKTSDICQDFDGRVFDMKDYQPGVTASPFHVHCRSTQVPYFNDEFTEGEVRAATDKNGKTYFIPANMKYPEWKKVFVDGGSKKDLKLATEPLEKNGKSSKMELQKDYDSDLAKKFGNEYYDELHQRVVDCSDEKLARVWKQYESKVKVADANYKGHEHCKGSSIYVNSARDAKGNSWQAPYQVTFHEAGHAIDSLALEHSSVKDLMSAGYHFSAKYKDGLFPKTIKEEVNEWVSTVDKKLKAEFKANTGNLDWFRENGFIDDWQYSMYEKGVYTAERIIPKYKKFFAYSSIQKEIKAIPMLERADLSDILEGATNVKLQCGFGHGAKYWKDRTILGVHDGLATEAFAEMVDSTMANPKGLEIIKKYLPNSYAVFQEMIETLLGE